MKKILAVLLCLICLVSSMAVSASAASELENFFVEVGTIFGFEPDEPIGYGLRYDSNKLLSGVSSVMYEPKPTVKFGNPGTYTVTDDYPLAVDYKFVCWEERVTGKNYYPGDKIFVDGELTLYAVWVKKDDNNIRPIRVIITAFEALKKTFQAFFGVFKVEYKEDLSAVPATWFDVEFYFLQVEDKYVGVGTGREFELRVKLPEGYKYDNFQKTLPLYMGGSFQDVTVNEYVYETDAQGNYVTDENGNKIVVGSYPVVKKQLIGSQEYSAAYSTVGKELICDRELHQVINVTLTDGVPDATTGTYITFCLPAGLLRYKDAEGNMHYSNETSVTLFTTRNT